MLFWSEKLTEQGTADPERKARAPSARADATKKRILSAAIEQFTLKGLAGARVDEIADAARVNKRMLYAHFGSKEDLWLAVLEDAYSRKRKEERLLEVGSLPPERAMALLVAFNLRYVVEHPEFVRILNEENLHQASYIRQSRFVKSLYPPLLELLDQVLLDGVRKEVFREGISPMQLYITIVSLGHFYVANQYTLSTIFDVNLMHYNALAEREAHNIDVVLRYLAKVKV